MYIPKISDGVPLIVIVFADHAAVKPVGKPIARPMPVAPVVANVIGVIGVETPAVLVLDAGNTVFELTVIVPVAFTVPQPPVNGMR